VDLRNHALDGGPHPPYKGGILRGKGRPIVKYRDTLWSSVPKTAEAIEMPFVWVMDWGGPKEAYIMASPSLI